MAGQALLLVKLASMMTMFVLLSLSAEPAAAEGGSWFGSLFGEAEVVPPSTRNVDALKHQLDELLTERDGYQKGSSQYERTEIAIGMRERRIESTLFLEQGMSEEDYDTLNKLLDEVVPLKEKLRDGATRHGHRRDQEEYERLRVLDDKVKKLKAPFARARRPGQRPLDANAADHGLTKIQRQRAKDLRKMIKENGDNVDKVMSLRQQLASLYDSARAMKVQNAALGTGRRKNHTLAKSRYLELSSLREELQIAQERGHDDLAKKLQQQLQAKTEFFRKAEEVEKDTRARRDREMARIKLLLDEATLAEDDSLVQRYRQELSEYDEPTTGRNPHAKPHRA